MTDKEEVLYTHVFHPHAPKNVNLVHKAVQATASIKMKIPIAMKQARTPSRRAVSYYREYLS
jgi:hypothetical protein